MQAIRLTPDNIRYFASYIHSSVDIQGRVIHVGPGTANGEIFLEIPLGEIVPQATIIITVGLDKSHPNTPADSDLRIAISDGITENAQFIVDTDNYANSPPCYPVQGAHDSVRVTPGTPVPATFKLIFTPFYKYCACETAQDGGYINTGTFNEQIDTTKPLFLHVGRDSSGEQFFIHSLEIKMY